jgi:hypothetical protein
LLEQDQVPAIVQEFFANNPTAIVPVTSDILVDAPPRSNPTRPTPTKDDANHAKNPNTKTHYLFATTTLSPTYQNDPKSK